ncbi:MAG: hypothetical protein LBU13_00965 [Synergistaceae bacterium]|nr:hypothetical protein [Synergistaceae bacterium]
MEITSPGAPPNSMTVEKSLEKRHEHGRLFSFGRHSVIIEQKDMRRRKPAD